MNFLLLQLFTKKTRSDISEGGRSSRLRNPEFAAKHKVRFLTKRKMRFRSKIKVRFLYFRTFSTASFQSEVFDLMISPNSKRNIVFLYLYLPVCICQNTILYLRQLCRGIVLVSAAGQLVLFHILLHSQ